VRVRTIFVLSVILADIISIMPAVATAQEQELYVMPDGVETRWSSFENLYAQKGRDGAENQTAKGHAFEIVPPGQSACCWMQKVRD
jgi:hypothetical protein